MSQFQIREETVRLVKQKECITHDFGRLAEEDFNFVRCANRKVQIIDGDAPSDANGIAQVYKNGAIYVRLNTQLLHYGVSTCTCSILKLLGISIVFLKSHKQIIYIISDSAAL